MGHNLTIAAADGYRFDGYLAESDGAPRGAVVVAMEMYGVNGYIRTVCDGWAADGYRAIAPDMCDYPDDVPRCPVLCHVGDRDTAVPPSAVAAFRTKRPEPVWRIYPSVAHGFDNFTRPARYHEAASRLARRRTLDFLRAHIG